MIDDIILNKAQTISRGIKRIGEEYQANPANLANPTKQDSIILNLQRACEAAIDLAMHLVSERGSAYRKTAGMLLISWFKQKPSTPSSRCG